LVVKAQNIKPDWSRPWAIFQHLWDIRGRP